MNYEPPTKPHLVNVPSLPKSATLGITPLTHYPLGNKLHLSLSSVHVRDVFCPLHQAMTQLKVTICGSSSSPDPNVSLMLYFSVSKILRTKALSLTSNSVYNFWSQHPKRARTQTQPSISEKVLKLFRGRDSLWPQILTSMAIQSCPSIISHGISLQGAGAPNQKMIAAWACTAFKRLPAPPQKEEFP